MPYAVTLRLDAGSAENVLRLEDALAAGGHADDRKRLGYAPHLTMSILPDGCDAASLRRALEGAVRGWQAMPISFAGLGVFPGRTGVLYVAPVVTAELLQRHAALAAALPKAHAHYRTGAWVPHVTLAEELAGSTGTGAALATLAELWHPFSGRLDRVDLVHFRPVEILWSQNLI
ncbi:2'-5' RNA ligase family protein [Limobrevibacterium gyesilva]|uniref:2'-5' RNA ligase family protein n=1 Tax=Limobrevibacterium gyesilva TaxID=2991712 RepID=A0AA41YKP1_9PROT|nr:2'-5' RNA ligase family protein [Limobrevibacterium gyesilva]MCW3475104.1 2'-5' RNA ligase family protein [Limobrevibacterium gyesilva]